MTVTFRKASSDTMFELLLSHWEFAGGTIVHVHGELDIATNEQLFKYVCSHIRRGASIIVDLSGLAFCDCRGASALSRIVDLANMAGCQITFTDPRPIVGKLFRLTGMDHRLPVVVK